MRLLWVRMVFSENHQLLGDARHGIASGDKLHDLSLACG